MYIHTFGKSPAAIYLRDILISDLTNSRKVSRFLSKYNKFMNIAAEIPDKDMAMIMVGLNYPLDLVDVPELVITLCKNVMNTKRKEIMIKLEQK